MHVSQTLRSLMDFQNFLKMNSEERTAVLFFKYLLHFIHAI